MNACMVAAPLLALALIPPAHADTGTKPGKRPALEEIIVTAQRREQSARTIPISLSAFPEAGLVRRQSGEVADLRYAAPNLEVAPAQGNRMTATVAMRGQVEADIVPTVDPAVGFFIDGVYVARATGANLRLLDLERVEVLRGPQGTLFGRNTIGGAINLVPNKPTDAFSGHLDIMAGTYELLSLAAVVNAPLIADAAILRVAALHTQHDGYGRSVPLDRELNDDDTDFVRAQLKLSGPAGIDLLLAYDTTRVDTGNHLITLVDAQPPATLVPAAAGHPEDSLDNYRDPYARLIYATHAGGFHSRVAGASATVTAALQDVTLRIASSIRELELQIADTDLDGTPYDVTTQIHQDQDQRQSSHELQLFGTAAGGIEWLGGAYYFEETATIDTLTSNLAPILQVLSNNRGDTDNRSRSIYGQLTWPLLDRLRLSAGARYSEDDRQLTSRNARWIDDSEICAVDPALLDDPAICSATLPVKTFHYVPFNLSVDYATGEQSMLYASYSRGFRSGGYNFRLTDSPASLPFDPEQVDSWQLGGKFDLVSSRVRLNMALFRSFYDEIQLSRVIDTPDGGATVVNMNAGEAHIEGGELELSAVSRQASISAALGVTSGKYTALAPGVVDLTLDSPFRFTPSATLALAGDVWFAAGRHEADVHVDYSWRDEVYFGFSEIERQGSYGLLSAQITLRHCCHPLAISLWGRNLTDTLYLVRTSRVGSGAIKGMPGDPRSFGLRLIYRFGRA